MQYNIDQLIIQCLQEQASKEGCSNLKGCPQEKELSDFLQRRLSPKRQDALLKHMACCWHCLDLVEAAQRAEAAISEQPPARMIEQAKNIAQGRPKRSIRNYKWQILASLAFGFSFVLTKYFLQFLALAVIFSLKWILDTGSTRTLIMIYEAWRKKDKDTAQRIIQDLGDRAKERK